MARLLADLHDVDIVGQSSSGSVWAPLASDTTAPYRILSSSRTAAGAGRELMKLGSPDVYYAIKPRSTSLGAAWWASRRNGVPVVADVDDWEMAFFYDNPPWLVRNLNPFMPNNVWATLRADRLVSRSAAVTVCSSWLRQRYGGTVIPHARDGRLFDPETSTELGRGVRERLSLGDSFVITFLGSAKVEKGLLEVIEAIDRLNDPRIRFLVVGGALGLPVRPWLLSLGRQPFRDLPGFLGATDLVVLAQRAARSTRGQVPAKVFDAMATGTPVIATAVSDLPSILEGCGLVVPVGDVAALSDAIAHLVNDRGAALELGMRGYRRFREMYSVDAVAPIMNNVVTSAVCGPM